MPFITTPGLPLVPLRFGQATLSGSVVKFNAFVMAKFTGTAGTDATQLVVTAVTGTILVGDTVAGTGITAGTTITGQVSGTTGGAGTYQLSASNTASSAALTSGSVPPGATLAYMTAETANIRWRDDGVDPTTAIGMLLPSATDLLYGGTLTAMRFIAVTGSPVLDVAFYKSP